MKLTIGPGASIIPNQPHCEMATSAPNIAPTDSKKPIVAFRGMRIERNRMISRINDNPTTTARYSGKAALSLSLISPSSAAAPVTPSFTS